MTSSLSSAEREALVRRFAHITQRPLAHQALFRHRHRDPTPPFHDEIILLWHNPLPGRALVMAFREAGKSTIAEESIVLMSALRSFRNCVILGENQERAIDRLTAIKYEFSTNELLINLFGLLQDQAKWNEAKVILSNGVVIQALGRGQEVRGMKHLDMRPDFCFCDDVEGKEHVKDEHQRKETLRWFFAEVLPALDKDARVRVNATPLDTASLPMQLKRLPTWTARVYPIKHYAASGTWQPTWPQRYPLSWIDGKELEMRRLGLHHEFMREYMCEPDDPAKKLFSAGMFKVEPRLHVWQPAYAFYDPARTVKSDASYTGWAVWSWIGTRLIVWDAGAERWLPDAMIAHMFTINAQYHPIKIGIERDGLEEFILQPLRREMTRRGVLLPVEPLRAPQSKLDFIGSLQPFLLSGEFVLAKELPDLVSQFINFPTGAIDIPNALAYALKMRAGLAVYDDFNHQHVVESVIIHERAPVWFCVNATAGLTTAVLVQFSSEGRLSIIKDWVREGDPAAVLSTMLKEARLEVDRELRMIIPQRHFATYDTIGLRAAAGKVPIDVRAGGREEDGRAEIRTLLRQTIKGFSALSVAHAASWTLNGFAAGYAREIGKNGIVSEQPKAGVYATLLEGLEAFAALMRFAVDRDSAPNYAFTATGHRYRTLLPQRTSAQELKDPDGRLRR